ncbi:protein DBF4 homolog B [Pteronotus mesoamericanus]|uniref:protein DBF4 homolog B n=1 Tax=Pteronotus mesoamericanus TaxID=1884717 RepID=UPI0023EDBB63|nr:protein DBF4 homolog B [Pteronotus parnellii mesoamericanus]
MGDDAYTFLKNNYRATAGAQDPEGAHGVLGCNTAALKKEYRGRERAEDLGEQGKGDDCPELGSSMAESRLRAPDLGVSSCLEKRRKSSLDAGRRRPFSGKSFYLDLPAGRNLQLLTGAIQQLGGVIEGFLSKEVSYIVSSRREAKAGGCGAGHRGHSSPREVRAEAPPTASPGAVDSRPSPNPADVVPMSRGKELLQKAITKQGSSSGGGSRSSSSLLTNARSWGVRILHVDEMMMHVQQLSLDALRLKKRGPKKPEGTCPAESRTRRVARLKAPFLKIEDESRKFRPFHHQFKSFPEISFLGPKDASPFEAPTSPGSSHRTREPRDQEASPQSATRTVPRRRRGYCECCQEAFEELRGHLQSAQHQGFALEAHPYAEVDRIITQLSHSFVDTPSQASLPRQPDSPALDCDLLCLETLSPSQPACDGAACAMVREEDNPQAPGSPDQDGVVGGMEAPAECVGAGEVPGPAASCQDLRGLADVTVDPPGALVSGSPTCQCLPTSCGFADLSSGPDPALVGHKRKVQFPSGNAEKKPGVSWPQASSFVLRTLSPCGTWTTDGRQLSSLPLPGHESGPLTSLLPRCPQQTSLSLQDPLPWQLPDRPAESWATLPPGPRGGHPPGSEGPEYAAPSPVSQQTGWTPSCSAAPGQLAAQLHSAAGTYQSRLCRALCTQPGQNRYTEQERAPGPLQQGQTEPGAWPLKAKWTTVVMAKFWVGGASPPARPAFRYHLPRTSHTTVAFPSHLTDLDLGHHISARLSRLCLVLLSCLFDTCPKGSSVLPRSVRLSLALQPTPASPANLLGFATSPPLCQTAPARRTLASIQ